MTRKHFEALARAIALTFSEDARETAGVLPTTWAWLRRRAAQRMADVCYATNPRFDRDRFVTACEAAR